MPSSPRWSASCHFLMAASCLEFFFHRYFHRSKQKPVSGPVCAWPYPVSFCRQGHCPRHSDRPRWQEAAVAREKPCLSARLTAAQCQRLIIKRRRRQQAAEATTAMQASRRPHATGRAQCNSISDYFMLLLRVKAAPSPEALAALHKNENPCWRSTLWPSSTINVLQKWISCGIHWKASLAQLH